MSPGTLAFSKYQGLGNDFLVVDLRNGAPVPSPEKLVGAHYVLARALCDRRYGVGGDGVLTLSAPKTPGASATMRVLNADGSEAEMCGNGLRCVAKHLLEADGKKAASITVDTLAGALTCQATWHGDEVTSVTVDMGRPRLLRREIPMMGDGDEPCTEQPLVHSLGTTLITAVSMGNPHAIAFVPQRGEALRELASSIGPAIESHETFPSRTNAEFAHVTDSTHLELWVWERGCGITQACGTGACATAVAACLTGRAAPQTEIEVALPGGPLAITVAENYETVYMRGPAVHVYDGTIDLRSLR